ncbi:unnamed protein product, partial [Allacma fusca]
MVIQTNQRGQLAECIVGQLYPNLVGKDKTDLINVYYAHSVTVMDTNTGKKKSLPPSGYIQLFFKNFWKSIRDKGGKAIGKATADALLIEDDFTAFEHNADETEEYRRWLQNHTAPPQKVFDYLRKTFPVRRQIILKCRGDLDFDEFFEKWPRMLDTTGAIQQDFQLCYPLVSDNLSSKWNEAAEKIAAFTLCKKKSLLQFGVVDRGNSNTIAAYFMLPALFRSKVKKITTVDSAKAFFEVINPLADIDKLAATSE